MAVSFGLEQFSKRMALKAEMTGGSIERLVQRAAIAADAALVQTTPVDTGRAKGNWNVGIGKVDTSVSDNTDPGGQETINRGKSAIMGWKIGKGTIFISNSLPYILPLENGSSKLRPEGMTRHGISAAVAQLKSGKVLG